MFLSVFCVNPLIVRESLDESASGLLTSFGASKARPKPQQRPCCDRFKAVYFYCSFVLFVGSVFDDVPY